MCMQMLEFYEQHLYVDLPLRALALLMPPSIGFLSKVAGSPVDTGQPAGINFERLTLSMTFVQDGSGWRVFCSRCIVQGILNVVNMVAFIFQKVS
jgi:hypothetical protein